MDTAPAVSKRTSMIVGARRHLEAGHEKYILDTIHSHPAQVCYQLNCSIGDFVHLLSILFRILNTNSIRIIDIVFMVKKGSVDISCGQINVQLLLSIIIGISSLCLVLWTGCTWGFHRKSAEGASFSTSMSCLLYIILDIPLFLCISDVSVLLTSCSK